MPGNDKILVKKSKIFLAALPHFPQYFGLIKNARRIRKRPPTRVNSARASHELSAQ
jgi:hypothetical protein